VALSALTSAPASDSNGPIARARALC
jgi:hypothetical protein